VAFARREYASSLRHFAFAGPQADRLRAFIALAQARGIKVVLVNMPVTRVLRPALYVVLIVLTLVMKPKGEPPFIYFRF
jgi:hypothetical protein